MTHLKNFPAWVLIRPAPDLPDQWVAHCLQYDVVTQGDSPSHALEMIFEAVAIVLIEDLRAGVSPDRRRAPDELWQPLMSIFQHGEMAPTQQTLKNAEETHVHLAVSAQWSIAAKPATRAAERKTPRRRGPNVSKPKTTSTSWVCSEATPACA